MTEEQLELILGKEKFCSSQSRTGMRTETIFLLKYLILLCFGINLWSKLSLAFALGKHKLIHIALSSAPLGEH